MLIAFLVTAGLVGCEKKDSHEAEVVKSDDLKKVDIRKLKEVFAKLVNADVREVSYNEEKEMFMMFGTEQISLKDLTKYYDNSK